MNKSFGDDFITLNIGGRLFTTTRGTLTNKEPDSVLAAMFNLESNLAPGVKDRNGNYMIDRSGTYFEPILNYLRTGQLIYDAPLNPQGILEEARFFGLQTLAQELQDILNTSVSVNPDTLALNRQDVIKAIIQTCYTTELRFQGVNLAGADLRKLDLRHINFKYACLRGCNLSHANLNYCNLERADLSHSNLDNAQLLGVKGLCANFESASLIGCNFEDPSGGRSNLEGVNMKNACLEGSNMTGVNLRVSCLKDSNLKNCLLRGAILAGADLERCNLSGSDLFEANLRGANFKDAELELMQTPLHMSQSIR